MSGILDDPRIKELKPQSEREGLLYLKAYFEAIEATLQASKDFGVSAVEDLHGRILKLLEQRINPPR